MKKFIIFMGLLLTAASAQAGIFCPPSSTLSHASGDQPWKLSSDQGADGWYIATHGMQDYQPTKLDAHGEVEAALVSHTFVVDNKQQRVFTIECKYATTISEYSVLVKNHADYLQIFPRPGFVNSDDRLVCKTDGAHTEKCEW